MFCTALHLLLVGVSLFHNAALPLDFPSFCRQLLVGVTFSLLPSPTCFSKTACLYSVRGAGVETTAFNQTSASGCSDNSFEEKSNNDLSPNLDWICLCACRGFVVLHGGKDRSRVKHSEAAHHMKSAVDECTLNTGISQTHRCSMIAVLALLAFDVGWTPLCNRHKSHAGIMLMVPRGH